MELSKFKLATLDDSFRDEIFNVLNNTLKLFNMSKISKKFWQDRWQYCVKIYDGSTNNELSRLTLEVISRTGDNSWRATQSSLNVYQETVVTLDLANERQEDFLEICKELAESAESMKMKLIANYGTVLSKYSYNLKPKKKISIMNNILNS